MSHTFEWKPGIVFVVWCGIYSEEATESAKILDSRIVCHYEKEEEDYG